MLNTHSALLVVVKLPRGGGRLRDPQDVAYVRQDKPRIAVPVGDADGLAGDASVRREAKEGRFVGHAVLRVGAKREAVNSSAFPSGNVEKLHRTEARIVGECRWFCRPRFELQPRTVQKFVGRGGCGQGQEIPATVRLMHRIKKHARLTGDGPVLHAAGMPPHLVARGGEYFPLIKSTLTIIGQFSPVIELTIASIFLATALWRSENESFRRQYFLRCLVTAPLCSIIFGFGFMVEPILWGVNNYTAYDNSPVYMFEYKYSRFIFEKIVSLVNGIPLGVLLSALLSKWRKKISALFSVAISILSLLTVDFYIYAYNGLFWLYPVNVYIINRIIFSVISDFVGGVVAGWLCWLFCVRIGEKNNTPTLLLRKKLHVEILAIIVMSVFTIMVVFVFIRRIPENVNFVIMNYQQADITFKTGAFWTAPMDELRLRSDGGLPLSGDIVGTRNEMRAKIASVGKCTNARDALYAADHSPDSAIPLQISDGPVDFIGSGQSITFFATDNQRFNIASIEIPHNGYVTIRSLPRDSGHSIEFSSGTKAVIPINPGGIIVFSTSVFGMPVIKFDGKSINPEERPAPVSVYCNTESRRLDNDLSRVGDLAIASGEMYFVMRVLEAPDTASFRFILDAQSAEVPPKFWVGARPPSLRIASWVKFHVGTGTLAIGSRRVPLERGDVVAMAGDLININQYDDGSISIEGNSAYITLNGELITRSIFELIPSNVKYYLIFGPLGLFAFVSHPKVREYILRMLGL